MGLSGLAGNEPEWLEAVQMWESALAKHNKPASGLAFGTPEQKKMLARGKSFTFTGTDIFALQGQVGELNHMRDNFKTQNYEGIYKVLGANY